MSNEWHPKSFDSSISTRELLFIFSRSPPQSAGVTAKSRATGVFTYKHEPSSTTASGLKLQEPLSVQPIMS